MAARRKRPSSVLALDTAGAACSAALWRDGRVIARRFESLRRGHAERLVPMIEAVMAEGAMAYRDLDRIAVTVGPGGFTGVRIGLATARGLALASRRPLIGISNFQVLAAAAKAEAPADGSLAVVIDAKRRDLYVQAFAADLSPRSEPAAVLPEDLAAFLPPGPLLVVGDGADQALPALATARETVTRAKTPGVVDAAELAELAAAIPLERDKGDKGDKDGEGGDRDTLRPLYLRPPDAVSSAAIAPAAPNAADCP